MYRPISPNIAEDTSLPCVIRGNSNNYARLNEGNLDIKIECNIWGDYKDILITVKRIFNWWCNMGITEHNDDRGFIH